VAIPRTTKVQQICTVRILTGKLHVKLVALVLSKHTHTMFLIVNLRPTFRPFVPKHHNVSEAVQQRYASSR
jgi:hypothetical protein